MSTSRMMQEMMSKYLAQARKSKRENRMIFNHVCIRVEDIDEAERLLVESFGFDGFLRPGGETFEEEKEFRVAWLDEHDIYLELAQFDREQEIGYDTGVGQPIGHLSEIGFFVPDMDLALSRLAPLGWQVTSKIDTPDARMYKVNNTKIPGIPVELIDILTDSTDFLPAGASNED
jgi:catechol 2,3-dioxygenase-like lactoylglutathione lyase family enzyme